MTNISTDGLNSILQFVPGRLDDTMSRHILSFYTQFANDAQENPSTSAVLSSPMGSGKSSLLVAYATQKMADNRTIPMLISAKEIVDGQFISRELNKFHAGCCIHVDTDNVNEYVETLYNYPFVVITHARLELLAKGRLNFQPYKFYQDDYGDRTNRLIFIDEKPNFTNFESFDIGKKNNMVDWFDTVQKTLANVPDIGDYLSEHGIPKNYLNRENLRWRRLEIARYYHSLLRTDVNDKSIPVEPTLELTDDLKTWFKLVNENAHLLDPALYNRAIAFQKLLTQPGTGFVIYEDTKKYITFAEKIDYSKLGPFMVLDGTASFEPIYNKIVNKTYIVTPIRDYSNTTVHHEEIATSAQTRMTGRSQRVIAERIKVLRLNGRKLFPVVTKNDFPLYDKLDTFNDEEAKFYLAIEEVDSDGRVRNHLFALVGKNFLRNYPTIYMSSLPNKTPDVYMAQAVAWYEDEITSTEMSHVKGKWFIDPIIESVYRGNLLADILQIYFRGKIREWTLVEPNDLYLATNNEEICEAVQRALPGSKLEKYTPFDQEAYNRSENIKQIVKAIVTLHEKFGDGVSIARLDKKDYEFFRKSLYRQPESYAQIVDELKFYNLQIMAEGTNKKKYFVKSI